MDSNRVARGIGLCSLLAIAACASPVDPQAVAPCSTGDREALAPERFAEGRGDAERGAVVFARECARCHSTKVIDRGSRLFRDYPRLDCASFLDRVSDGYLRKVIHDGGESVGLDKLMKPFGETLGAGDIDDVIRFLRSRVAS